MPNIRSVIVTGPGTVLIKHLKSRCELSVWKMTKPLARKPPVLSKY